MAQFEALLDFSDAPAENGKVDNTNGRDPFDPFGPSPTVEAKAGLGGGDLLVDFSLDAEVSNRENGTDTQLNEGETDNVNPLYEFTASDNFMAQTEPVNPLYDFSAHTEEPQIQEKNTSASTNPLYDFLSAENTNGHKESTNGHDYDLLGSTSGTNVSDDSGVTMETVPTIEEDNVMINKEDKQSSRNFEIDTDEGETSQNENGIEERNDDSLKGEEEEDTSEPMEPFDQKPVWEPVEENQMNESVSFEEPVREPSEEPQVSEDVEIEEPVRDPSEERPISQSISRGSVSEEEILLDHSEQSVETSYEEPPRQEEEEELPVKEEEEEELPAKEEEEEKPTVIEEPASPEKMRSRSSSRSSLEHEDQKQEEVERQDVKSVTRVSEERKAPETKSDKPDVIPDHARSAYTDDAVNENGMDSDSDSESDDDIPRDPNIARESKQKDEVQHFKEMYDLKTKFESGKLQDDAPKIHHSVQDDIAVEGGVYENEPVVDPNLARESDRNMGEGLPEMGTAHSLLEKFKQIQTEKSHFTSPSKKFEIASPDVTGPSEYVTEPKPSMVEEYDTKAEAGVFENEPQDTEDVVKSGDYVEELLPEKGMARNILAKFQRLESDAGNKPPPSPGQRELTPDRTGKVEYISEPRNTFQGYEGRSEAGVFESQPSESDDIVRSYQQSEEILPESGTAKNLVSKFKQIETELKNKSPPSPGKRELTPDRHTKGEYVSEPRGHIETYEGRPDTGVFESQPMENADVVRSDDYRDAAVPERGFAKNTAARFRDMQNSQSSPTESPRRNKEFTPPREDMPGKFMAGVLESTPQELHDVVKSSDQTQEELPTQGYTKGLVSRFKQWEAEHSPSPPSPSYKKEFTPPRGDVGVFENQPAPSLEIETRVAESGILESQPAQRPDLGDVNPEAELPEAGFAKNMVSKYRQIESESAKSPSTHGFKEFTPPRGNPRVDLLSPKSPAGGDRSVQPSDLPGQYHEQVSAGVYENMPDVDPEMPREDDTDWNVGMPKANAAKKRIDKFKKIQAKAAAGQQTSEPLRRKDSSSGSAKKKEAELEPKERMFFFATQTEKCASCQKTVYAMEKLEMNKTVYHKTCFKCTHCKRALTPATYSMNEGVLFCTTHFKQLFARKGNYDEGFGRQQYKKKWKSEPNLLAALAAEQETVIAEI